MSRFSQNPIPALGAGIGLKPHHYRAALDGADGLDFFEVHAENFMGDGGPPHRWLAAIRETRALSVHGVYLSIGGRNDLDKDHLARLRRVVDRYDPAIVSEHLAWSADGGVFFNDLIAPPLTSAALARTCDHVDEVQEALGRRILIENPSSYLAPATVEIPETDFLNELARRTGCGILLDVNNVYVSAFNIGFDAECYIDAIDAGAVGEIHVAGHAVDRFDDVVIRVDDHGSPPPPPVLALLERFARRAGLRPVLFEWDTRPPALDALAQEALAAKEIMRAAGEGAVHAS
ncbi:MNIO family bufferin maturase [Amphiplicatus metriothermophilus]|uniref:Uncharacterized protein n=1 Tax=Amphiplicatus metriothermophilus TaxID=1519374 RepID=A0A239PZJ9_9PROT|nr:DUF692 domain-containing protein [Amphiplicatus metriothermophilus]MBB5518271.1 hypothetical protein [Amphiplicatus metriothermophilus]SNT75508.1 hypothetical protein SAMN06297382_2775 [Amphiplicatus metriothermophilus]